MTVTAGSTGLANGGGAWITFMVGYELWYWRADTRQVFDLGESSSAFTAASPDGRWLLYYGHDNSGKQFEPVFALDTTTGTSTKIAESLTDLYLAPYSQLAMFSPDSRRAAFYANATGTNDADLVAYDFATGQMTTLTPHVYTFTSTASAPNVTSTDRISSGFATSPSLNVKPTAKSSRLAGVASITTCGTP